MRRHGIYPGLVTHYAVSIWAGQAVQEALCCKAHAQHRVRYAEHELTTHISPQRSCGPLFTDISTGSQRVTL
jgi:hypothetical protein